MSTMFIMAQTGDLVQLPQLDLSTMMPFVRRDSIKGNEMEMFVFQRPRFARATHVRNLDLTSQGQKEDWFTRW